MLENQQRVVVLRQCYVPADDSVGQSHGARAILGKVKISKDSREWEWVRPGVLSGQAKSAIFLEFEDKKTKQYVHQGSVVR